MRFCICVRARRRLHSRPRRGRRASGLAPSRSGCDRTSGEGAATSDVSRCRVRAMESSYPSSATRTVQRSRRARPEQRRVAFRSDCGGACGRYARRGERREQWSAEAGTVVRGVHACTRRNIRRMQTTRKRPPNCGRGVFARRRRTWRRPTASTARQRVACKSNDTTVLDQSRESGVMCVNASC